MFLCKRFSDDTPHNLSLNVFQLMETLYGNQLVVPIPEVSGMPRILLKSRKCGPPGNYDTIHMLILFLCIPQIRDIHRILWWSGHQSLGIRCVSGDSFLIGLKA